MRTIKIYSKRAPFYNALIMHLPDSRDYCVANPFWLSVLSGLYESEPELCFSAFMGIQLSPPADRRLT
jgi:hypothetical protein